MTQPYNLSSVESTTNVFSMMQEIDALAGNFITVGILLGLAAITFTLLMRRSPPAESFFASSLVTSLASLGFFFAGWLPIFWVIGFSMLFAFSSVGLYVVNRT